MTKRVSAIILVDPGKQAKTSQKEHNSDDAANTYQETDIGQILLLGQLNFFMFVINVINHKVTNRRSIQPSFQTIKVRVLTKATVWQRLKM